MQANKNIIVVCFMLGAIACKGEKKEQIDSLEEILGQKLYITESYGGLSEGLFDIPASVDVLRPNIAFLELTPTDYGLADISEEYIFESLENSFSLAIKSVQYFIQENKLVFLNTLPEAFLSFNNPKPYGDITIKNVNLCGSIELDGEALSTDIHLNGYAGVGLFAHTINGLNRHREVSNGVEIGETDYTSHVRLILANDTDATVEITINKDRALTTILAPGSEQIIDHYGDWNEWTDDIHGITVNYLGGEVVSFSESDVAKRNFGERILCASSSSLILINPDGYLDRVGVGIETWTIKN